MYAKYVLNLLSLEMEVDEFEEAKRELANAATHFESGEAGWRAYAAQLNEKLDGTELQNSLVLQQIKILSAEPRPDPLDFNTKKILFEQKLKKKKGKQREQIQNEMLALIQPNFFESINFKNGD